MPFSYPHFGSLNYIFEVIFREIGRNDLIIPNKPSKKTIQLGARYSPEFVCTPFKMTLGTFIESLNRGATELGMGGGNGYCRFRYYWFVQKLILEDLGYDCKFVTFDYEDPLQLLRTFKNAGKDVNYLQTFRAFRYAWVKNRLTDKVDELLYKYRTIESEKGVSEKFAEKLYRDIVEIKGFRNCRKFLRNLPEIFEQEIDVIRDTDPLKIAINGEVYVVLEPALNLDINKRLNELGVITKATVTLRKFLDIGQRLNPFYKMEHEKAIKYSRKYVPYNIGGETRENLGDVILYKKKGWDGLIHLYPFTCMPEIITRSIFPQVSRDYDMPVLSLVLDEHTGEAGYQTRLEAFVDLLKRRRDILREKKRLT
ncbi:MAG: CoA protein activase [Candidatus Heimdallarchaeota archaeon]